jgi:peptide/nickel transport system substrate-binding protein
MIRSASMLSLLVAGLALVGCAAPVANRDGSAPAGARPAQPRTLLLAVNTEVSNLNMKIIGPTNPERTTRIFSAGLTLIDGQGNALPYLIEAMPQLNTDTWRVLPDGRMETTYKIRPGLTWHDGQPLTADDVAFAHQVYTHPGLPVFEPKPQDRIERLTAVDPQTVRVEWRSPFLDNGQGLDPLPRHILAEPFATFLQDPAGQRDSFLSLRYWTTEYVGAGPYRVANWEPASFIEGAAFDGHALGRPKIDRLVLRFINDENTVLASLLAGQVHLSISQAIRFEHAMILRQEAGFDSGEGKGKNLFLATSMTTAVAQHRPEHQQTPALLDPRVRRAVAHSIDKESINEGIFEGQAPIPYSFVQTSAPYAAEVERAITKYPYDPRRSEQIMAEAGYAKDREGFFVTSTGDRLRPSLWNSAGAQREKLLAIVVDTWTRAGFEMQPFVMPNALERDQQARATYPGILIHGISQTETGSAQSLSSEQIGTPANRWNGNNRGGFSNPDYDRLFETFSGTLDRREQINAFVQMMRIQSELMPNFPLHYGLNVTSHLPVLKGPEAGVNETNNHWNIHEWELV